MCNSFQAAIWIRHRSEDDCELGDTHEGDMHVSGFLMVDSQASPFPPLGSLLHIGFLVQSVFLTYIKHM